ncbi:quinone-dependent dihydroorotate dehydrogenase [Rhodobaculum claviforme]|uniref:Dihydroorotate dehydrogenase (quinone) n=1 Tax=Rhodobaculum claviforme TaxID=1549854 RepID=A0A934TJB5_9RHOB|nr:quinone-dependent dihydroorotate dehydrogenase [Rhodobaculum claviforme]MBK5926663.1 dihydroorotate dehydrogenase (quinone) [Rhodobaculum claviforme]
MTGLIERAGLAVLARIDPERAHGLALTALRAGVVPMPAPVASPRLAVTVAGLRLDNPLGLAAGFDKNAVALAPLSRAGFGFLEIGAVTPRPQPGNPRPRLFRLPQDGAVINRFGFNNDGAEAVAARLERRPASGPPVGVNLGANKDSEDRAGDFAAVLTRLGPHVDFATVNVSSPNTERLRDLQGPAALAALLERVMAARAGLARPIPVFLKIAPDLDDAALEQIAEVATDAGIHAIVATNTTLARSGLRGRHADQAGGLSGRPLFAPSTRVLARLSALTDGRMPLIGVGGVASAEDALAKIHAGAVAVQLYTALSTRGLSLVGDILGGLDAALAAAGHDSVAQAVGARRAAWLQPARIAL